MAQRRANLTRHSTFLLLLVDLIVTFGTWVLIDNLAHHSMFLLLLVDLIVTFGTWVLINNLARHSTFLLLLVDLIGVGLVVGAWVLVNV